MPEHEYDRDEWIRVRDKELGYESSIRGSQLAHGDYEVLKQDPLDVYGNPRPTDYHLDDDKAKTAPSKKES